MLISGYIYLIDVLKSKDYFLMDFSNEKFIDIFYKKNIKNAMRLDNVSKLKVSFQMRISPSVTTTGTATYSSKIVVVGPCHIH